MKFPFHWGDGPQEGHSCGDGLAGTTKQGRGPSVMGTEAAGRENGASLGRGTGKTARDEAWGSRWQESGRTRRAVSSVLMDEGERVHSARRGPPECLEPGPCSHLTLPLKRRPALPPRVGRLPPQHTHVRVPERTCDREQDFPLGNDAGSFWGKEFRESVASRASPVWEHPAPPNQPCRSHRVPRNDTCGLHTQTRFSRCTGACL